MSGCREVPDCLTEHGLPWNGIILSQLLVSLKNPNTEPELLFKLQKLIRCGEVYFKQLSPADVDHRQDRLLMGKCYVENFIKPILRYTEVPSSGIPISIYDTSGQRYPLLFVERNDGKYVITHREAHWRDVCQALGLKGCDCIKLWTLRHSETDELCFVIEKRSLDE